MWIDMNGLNPMRKIMNYLFGMGLLQQHAIEPITEQALSDFIMTNDPDMVNNLMMREHLCNGDCKMIEIRGV